MLIFSSAFNGFNRVWYQNLACRLSILFMSKLTCSSALVANNTIRKFIDWYYSRGRSQRSRTVSDAEKNSYLDNVSTKTPKNEKKN